MADQNIQHATGTENSVAEQDDPARDHQINLSVTGADWEFIEQHAKRIKERFPNRRLIPQALSAYDVFLEGRKAIEAQLESSVA